MAESWDGNDYVEILMDSTYRYQYKSWAAATPGVTGKNYNF